MLEHLPSALGRALHDVRAGLEGIAFNRFDFGPGTGAIQVQSLAFADHAPIPLRYTADGDGDFPGLSWTGVPAQAGALVLLVEDADAPGPHPLLHLSLINLAPADGHIAEGPLLPEAVAAGEAPGAQVSGVDGGAQAGAGMASDAVIGTPARAAAGAGEAAQAADVDTGAPPRNGPCLGPTSFFMHRWVPPDPPPGHGVHRYAFQVYALRESLPTGLSRAELLSAVGEQALASGLLVGTYERDDTETQSRAAVIA